MFCEVCNDCGLGCKVVVGWRRGVMVDDDCGWLCVLRKYWVCSRVWGRGTDCGGCSWKDVGMVATR